VVLAIFDIIAAIIILTVAREMVKGPEPATQTGQGGTLLPV
jgi:ACS family hexuronate transporter-like MFS transporter